MVLAGDNVLDFSLSKFIEYFEAKKKTCVMSYYSKEDIGRVKEAIESGCKIDAPEGV